LDRSIPEIDAMHDWDVSTEEARRIQDRLRDQVVASPLDDSVEYVAGADVSFERGSDDLYAAVVVLDADDLEPIEIGRSRMEAVFPYVPGLLSFREAPALLEAWESLEIEPDLLVCDGHGRAHPRRFGLACHVGVWLDQPTIGGAQNILVGTCDEPAPQKGSHEPLRDDGDVIGRALRTRDDVHSVYVSIGHRVSLEGATRQILEVAPTYKIPEPIRAAHREVNDMRES
jgi:deoxyribonuclease V